MSYSASIGSLPAPAPALLAADGPARSPLSAPSSEHGPGRAGDGDLFVAIAPQHGDAATQTLDLEAGELVAKLHQEGGDGNWCWGRRVASGELGWYSPHFVRESSAADRARPEPLYETASPRETSTA